MNDDLASGFRAVDRASDFAVFSGCLDLVGSLPFFAECKAASFDQIHPSPGRTLLDVGCGLGDDAATLASRVAPGGVVVGVDGSRAMIAEAQRRHGRVAGLSFAVADAAALPFEDASFDACRIDRVLQHVADPAPVVREMARVLRPGGVLIAYDNDWETLTVDAPDRRTTRACLNHWCDRFPSGWIGRRMAPLFLAAGLREVEATPKTLVLRELDVADQLYRFFSTADRLVAEGRLSQADAEGWAQSLREADRAGRFFSSYTGFLVRGVKPGAA